MSSLERRREGRDERPLTPFDLWLAAAMMVGLGWGLFFGLLRPSR